MVITKLLKIMFRNKIVGNILSLMEYVVLLLVVQLAVY